MNYQEELNRLMIDNPELTLDNDGYQEIPNAVIQNNREAFDKITEILRCCVGDFVRFQNFKPRADGTFAVRCQTRWDRSFTGVRYIPLDEFKAIEGQANE